MTKPSAAQPHHAPKGSKRVCPRCEKAVTGMTSDRNSYRVFPCGCRADSKAKDFAAFRAVAETFLPH